MMQTYTVEGMTCGGCKSNVTEALMAVEGVNSVDVNLENKSADVSMDYPISRSILEVALPDKFTLGEQRLVVQSKSIVVDKSKLVQLKPLFLILLYIFVASILLHKDDWDSSAIMIDFMGLFFIVFSFFKMLDIKGFASSFSMYDPIANRLPGYGLIYPFVETILGIMFLMRFNIMIALLTTIFVLGITTYGITRTLLAKRNIKCACLGTALNLPMTEATFIENAIMIVMSVGMLLMGLQ